MLDSIKTSIMSRRRFLASSALTVGSLASAGTLLDACNTITSSSSSAGTGKSVTTLTVMYASNEFTKDYIAEFEKLNPDLKINFIDFDQNRLDAMLAANTPPDFVRGGGVGSANISARGLALNLDPYLAKSKVLKKQTATILEEPENRTGQEYKRVYYVQVLSSFASVWQCHVLLKSHAD